MKKYKVGLLGFGLSGRVFHAPFVKVNQDLELAYVSTSRKDEVLNRYPDAQVVNDWKDIVTGDCDIVINTLPNDMHYEVTKLALENKKHVIVEKPFVIESKNGQELIDLAKKQGVVLSVFHNRRWDSDILTLQKLLRSGELGKITSFQNHFSRYKPASDQNKWREQKDVKGSGFLYDLGSHLIDQCLLLFGRPKSIFCDLQFQRHGADDYFNLIFYYENFRAILYSHMVAPEHDLRLKVDGYKKSFVRKGLDVQGDQLANGMTPNNPDFAIENKDDFILVDPHDSVLPCRYIEPECGNYGMFFEEFIKEIRCEENEYVTPESSLEVIKLIELAFKSFQEKRVIDLEP